MPMNEVELDWICREQMNRWRRRAVEAHATPVLMLSVGHDQHSGALGVHITEDLPDDQLVALTKFLYEEVVVKGRRF